MDNDRFATVLLGEKAYSSEYLTKGEHLFELAADEQGGRQHRVWTG